jgi:hypothetical protein
MSRWQPGRPSKRTTLETVILEHIQNRGPKTIKQLLKELAPANQRDKLTISFKVAVRNLTDDKSLEVVGKDVMGWPYIWDIWTEKNEEEDNGYPKPEFNW